MVSARAIKHVRLVLSPLTLTLTLTVTVTVTVTVIVTLTLTLTLTETPATPIANLHLECGANTLVFDERGVRLGVGERDAPG